MKLWTAELNPVTVKRWRRFRAMRRAWWSLLVLSCLYITSLFSEIICNNIPLCVRQASHWYFPALRFHPEDTFLHNGRQTRPDYRAIAKSPGFTSDPSNFMLFPPIPFSPLETLDPADVPLHEAVTLEFKPEPKLATLTLGRDLAIRKASGLDPFLSMDPDGERFTRFWSLPEAAQEALDRRWRNEAAPSFSLRLQPAIPTANEVELSLAEFTPRPTAPATLRLLLREPSPAGARSGTVAFDRTLQVTASTFAFWSQLGRTNQAALASLAAARLKGPADDLALTLAGTPYLIHATPAEVRWPFKPVRDHWLGIDSAGRDVLARLLYGLRTSMTFGFLLVAFTMALGTLLGALQGYFGKAVDLAGQRFTEIWSAIPFLYVMILLGAVYGRGFLMLLTCYALFNWIGISYYIRAEFLRLRHLPFVEAARGMGLPHRAIIFRHILPNALTPLITFFPFYLVGAIGSLAALDYLGFGLPPPTPSWGELLSQAQQFRWAWWLILYPAGALFVVMLLGVFVGEGVRNAYDPRPPTRYE